MMGHMFGYLNPEKGNLLLGLISLQRQNVFFTADH